MIEGGSKQKLTPLAINALPSIISLLQNEKSSVKAAAADALAKVAEFNPEVIAAQSQIMEHLKAFSIMLQDSAEISRSIALLFNSLAEYLPQLNQNHCLHQQAENIINLLSQTAWREDQQSNSDLIDGYYMAMINWIHQVNNQVIARKCLLVYFDQFKKIIENPAFKANIQNNNHLKGILSIFHSSLLRLIGCVENELSVGVFQLITNYFSLINDVSTDGLLVFGALATATKEQYQPHAEMTYNYLKHALQKINEPEIFRTAISVMGDFARAIEENFSKYLPEMIPALINCLHLQELTREQKLSIFICFGDMFLSCKYSIGVYLEQICTIIDHALANCIEMQYSNDCDAVDYAELLKEKLIETYICMVHALEKPEDNQLLQSHFPKLMDFIQKTCANDINPTIDYIRQCLMLIADIANFHGKAVVNLVKTQFTQDLIHTLNKFNHIEENKQTIEYAIQIIRNL